jgi:uncharacterized protein with HEPN domain
MSKHDLEVTLKQLKDNAEEAIGLLSGIAYEDFRDDRLLELSITRLLEVIGEAAHRLLDEQREKMHDIPWEQIIGLRNRLIHGYDSVDKKILWNIVHDDLPDFVRKIQTYV